MMYRDHGNAFNKKIIRESVSDIVDAVINSIFYDKKYFRRNLNEILWNLADLRSVKMTGVLR